MEALQGQRERLAGMLGVSFFGKPSRLSFDRRIFVQKAQLALGQSTKSSAETLDSQAQLLEG